MAIYMIGYDLKEGEDYSDLIDAIKKLSGTWWHCLDSTWLVKSDKEATDLRDALKPHLRSADKLLVGIFTVPSAWVGFNEECSKWLKDNL